MSRKRCKKCGTNIPLRDAVVATSRHETFWFCSTACLRRFFSMDEVRLVGRFDYVPGGDK